MLLFPIMINGCASHVRVVRVYDPYARDYHVWEPDEDVYYNRWLGERHLERREFRKLDKDRQKDYWTWRHSQAAPQPRP